MEELLKKLVNLGIGAAKSLEENLQTTFKSAEKGINELIAKGDTSTDEGAAKVKKFVNDLLVSVKDYESKAKEMTESLTNALKEFNATGKGKIEELSKKVEEVANKIKSKAGGNKPA